MKILFFLAVLLFSGSTYAQVLSNKQVICMDTASLVGAVTGPEVQEKLFWAAKSDSDDSKYVLFVNGKTKKWTFIQLNEKMACILGTGEQSTLVLDIQPIKK